MLATYQDGSHQAELFRGPLMMRYRNLHTGKSVVENLSGRGRVTYYRNGDFASITVVTGRFGTSIAPGNDQGRGLYRVGGKNSSLTVTHDGHRQIAMGRQGTLESICPKIHGNPGSWHCGPTPVELVGIGGPDRLVRSLSNGSNAVSWSRERRDTAHSWCRTQAVCFRFGTCWSPS